VTASGITASEATIAWTTDEAADSQLEYGPATAYGSSTPRVPTLVTTHSQALSGLTASTLYHYRVKSKDALGNLAVSSDQTFRTAAPLPDVIVTSLSYAGGIFTSTVKNQGTAATLRASPSA